MTSISDYQQFALADGRFSQIGARMQKKLDAIPLPDLKGKEVLDIGCDNGFWSYLAAQEGAAYVLGIDRNRPIRERGFTDLIVENRRIVDDHPWLKTCEFREMDLGRQWHELRRFDVIFMFSMYHHVFQNTGGDHAPIWYWLRRQIKDDGVLLWENPVDDTDNTVRMDVDWQLQPRYRKDEILAAAAQYFDYEYIGPALHEPSREVYRFTPKPPMQARIHGIIMHGHGGARDAFEYAGRRRCREFSHALDWYPYPGSLNVRASSDFPWDACYYRALILDVVDRHVGVDGAWAARWARFYPVILGGKTMANEWRANFKVCAFRFEGEDYSDRLIELVADHHLGYPVSPIFKNEVFGDMVNTRTHEPATEVEIRVTR